MTTGCVNPRDPWIPEACVVGAGATPAGGVQPIVVTPHMQPCMAIDGCVNPDITLVYVDGVAQYLTPSGPVTGVEILDPCDPRCTACCGGEVVCCTPEQKAEMDTFFEGIVNG